MKRRILPCLIAVLVLMTACTTSKALPPAAEEAPAPREEKEDAIVFWTKDAGTASIEEMDGRYWLTVPRTETYLAPLRAFVSEGGEPIFFSAEEGVTVKVYRDALLWMHWGKAEYAPWIFTERPHRFYFTF